MCVCVWGVCYAKLRLAFKKVPWPTADISVYSGNGSKSKEESDWFYMSNQNRMTAGVELFFQLFKGANIVPKALKFMLNSL